MTIGEIKAGHIYIIQHDDDRLLQISFQDGPVKEVGVNGIQNIDLIEVLLDRMHYLQRMENGKYACDENGAMIHCLEVCKAIDTMRTKARQKRNVEGTNQI